MKTLIIKGIEVANTDEFWSAYYEDRSRFFKGAIQSILPAARVYYPELDCDRNYVDVDLEGCTFFACHAAIKAIQGFVTMLHGFSEHFVAKIETSFHDTCILRIRVLQ